MPALGKETLQRSNIIEGQDGGQLCKSLRNTRAIGLSMRQRTTARCHE